MTDETAEPKWWRKDDDEFNGAMTSWELARALNRKALAEIERLRTELDAAKATIATLIQGKTEAVSDE